MIKRVYQSVYYEVSKKKSEGNIIRISPNGKNYEYFFAYHDKNLWDATGHYIICMRAKDTWNELDQLDQLIFY